MSFRELNFRDDIVLDEHESNIFQTLLANQSPIMQGWFVVMGINLVLVLIHLF